jgi:hypothetical protein
MALVESTGGLVVPKPPAVVLAFSDVLLPEGVSDGVGIGVPMPMPMGKPENDDELDDEGISPVDDEDDGMKLVEDETGGRVRLVRPVRVTELVEYEVEIELDVE